MRCSPKAWWRWISRPGERKWHYQLTHHGLWDRDIPCAAILCDTPREWPQDVKALAQPSNAGLLLYVLDRDTGQAGLADPGNVAVPKGDVPGEWYCAHPADPLRRRATTKTACSRPT